MSPTPSPLQHGNNINVFIIYKHPHIKFLSKALKYNIGTYLVG